MDLRELDLAVPQGREAGGFRVGHELTDLEFDLAELFVGAFVAGGAVPLALARIFVPSTAIYPELLRTYGPLE